MQDKIIQEFMTPSPITINVGQSLEFAAKKMADENCRHLPVLDAGELVGVLPDRDIRFVESFSKLNAKELTVEDAYSEGPFTSEQNTSLKVVCAEMHQKKYGCALIMHGKQLVGIFTWIDALKLLSE